MSSKQILIVDDSPVVLKALSMKLRAKGYTVLTADTCPGGLEVARKQRPDLILLDISFPPSVDKEGVAWDGFLAMRWFKRFRETRDIPVIIMSGSEPEKHRARVSSSGAVAFLRKPMVGDQLLRAIRTTLERDPARA